MSTLGVDNGYEVLGDGEGEWKDHPDYQVERCWLNSLKWLTPVNQCQVSIPVIN